MWTFGYVVGYWGTYFLVGVAIVGVLWIGLRALGIKVRSGLWD